DGGRERRGFGVATGAQTCAGSGDLPRAMQRACLGLAKDGVEVSERDRCIAASGGDPRASDGHTDRLVLSARRTDETELGRRFVEAAGVEESLGVAERLLAGGR